MKHRIRSLVRKLADTRYFGRFVRIAVAVYRGPETREATKNLIEDQKRGDVQRDPESVLSSLLEALAVVNHRQVEIESFARVFNDEAKDRENLFRSLPVVLRRFARSQAEAQRELEILRKEFASSLADVVRRIETCEASQFALESTVTHVVRSSPAYPQDRESNVGAVVHDSAQSIGTSTEMLLSQFDECGRLLAELTGTLGNLSSRIEVSQTGVSLASRYSP